MVGIMGQAGHEISLTPAMASPVARSLVMQKASEEFQAERLSDLSTRTETTKEGLWRILSTTMAILNHTHAELDRSQKKIKALEQRVSDLEQISTTDELTGLKNRRGFREAFERELDRSKRNISSGGILVVIDLDNFKGINDTWSHLAGDACLRLVGATLMTEIRAMDTAARLGGDEFVLLWADARPDASLERIQKLAWRLNNLSLAWNGEEIPIRASVGVKPYKPGDKADEIFHAADNNLYADKSRSKDDQPLEVHLVS